MTLVKGSARKKDSHKREIKTYEIKGVQKRELRKLTEIEVKLQPMTEIINESVH